MNNSINLVPKVNKNTSSHPLLNKRTILRSIAIGTMFMVSFLSIVLFILIALSPLPSLKDREQTESKRLSFFNEMIVKLFLTKDRITQIKGLLKKRPVYSETISTVKQMLPSNTTLEEIVLNDNKVTLAVSSNSLAPLDELVNKITQYNQETKKFTKIMMNSVFYDIETKTYRLVLEFS